MEIRRIDNDISVASQIVASDLSAIAKAGYKTVICNRPDGEAGDQQAYAEIEVAAVAGGLEIIFQPVSSRVVTDEDGVEFAKLLESAAKPVLAYCRTGTRCTVLWCLSQSGKIPVDEIVGKASAAGYDMSGIIGRL